jgi:molybdopterin/thiamine biosynthesis adenylyltransferase
MTELETYKAEYRANQKEARKAERARQHAKFLNNIEAISHTFADLTADDFSSSYDVIVACNANEAVIYATGLVEYRRAAQARIELAAANPSEYERQCDAHARGTFNMDA